MAEGRIVKALSGFYYVQTGDSVTECKARGKFRMDGTSPLVGDAVIYSTDANGKGRIEKLLPRRNFFIRPAVANIDALVFVAANTNPVTDPFLIDRVSVIAEHSGCELIVCLNKTDLDSADELYDIFSLAGFPVVRCSAATGEGVDKLRAAMAGKVCAFTGNSGVGKSSLLNVLLPEAHIEVGEVSEKLGRGRHTTRHVQLYSLGNDCFAADTPGFASFEIEMMESIEKEALQYDFIDFSPYIGSCRFHDCAHLREPDCAVRQAVSEKKISESRYKSYVQLYELCAQHKVWENKSE